MFDRDVMAKNLSEIVQIESLSVNENDEDITRFMHIAEMLQKDYPLVHGRADVQVVNNAAFLYHIAADEAKNEPIMFMAHLDCVSVEAETKNDWRYNGYSGMIAEGRVFGRGTLDMKGQLIMFFEAIEEFLQSGRPIYSDIYFSLGFDEEKGGARGNAAVAKLLYERGVHLGMVLDEGGNISEGILGIKKKMALVGTCEKGFCSLKITIPGSGGHSSMPPAHTALGEICALGVKLEENQLKPRLTAPVEAFLAKIAPHMSNPAKTALGNAKLLTPLVLSILGKSPESNALIRTTTALTMASASEADNILPQSASLTVNFRILPGESAADVIEHVKKLAGKDAVIERLLTSDPSDISPMDDRYGIVENAVKRAYPDTAEVLPFIMVGGTDSRHFGKICEHIYKFAPVLFTDGERSMLHGVNESIRIECLEQGARYFYEVFNSYNSAQFAK